MNVDLFAHPGLYLLALDPSGQILRATPRCQEAGFVLGSSLPELAGGEAIELLERAKLGPIEGVKLGLEGGRSFRWTGGAEGEGLVFSLAPDTSDRFAIVETLLTEANVLLFAADSTGKLQFAVGGSEEAKSLRDAPEHNVLDANKDTPTEACIRLALEGTPTAILNEPLPGRYFDDHYAPVRDAAGNVTGVCGFAVDVSDRVQTEFKLRETVERLEKQSAALRSLSTPIIRVWDEIICLPVVGIVDSQRTADMMESLLASIVEEKARYAIVDLTGVEVVDTSTAEHLLRLFRAASILGVSGVLCGIRPAVAQTIVTLGVDLSGINTLRTLEEALRFCFVRRLAQKKKGATAREASQ
ncbi:MAG: STAS domain-containing protein [Proteobacteria bacterium]|nr:MAG: STAS domain-containing protein [Pseudomonadota bacterium]